MCWTQTPVGALGCIDVLIMMYSLLIEISLHVTEHRLIMTHVIIKSTRSYD